jgi:hypothetical protein
MSGEQERRQQGSGTMESREWRRNLNRRPTEYWMNLLRTRARRENQPLGSIDPRIVEYNYTRTFDPVCLEQWFEVFQDVSLNIFRLVEYTYNERPVNCHWFIWHRNILHRIETHHGRPSFFRPIGEELPHHIIFQAIASVADGEFYSMHLYGQQGHYLWDAAYAMLILDYDPAHFESVGLEPGDASQVIPWQMSTARMRIWLAPHQGPQRRICLHRFHFDRSSTLEIVRATVRGFVFNVTGCLFQVGTVFEDGRLVLPRPYLAAVLVTFPSQPGLVYLIVQANANNIGI